MYFSSLLSGKVWKNFSVQKTARICFEATVRSLLAFMERLRPDQGDTKEICRKALWSYATYDEQSELASWVRQHCMKDLAKKKRSKAFAKNVNGKSQSKQDVNHGNKNNNMKGKGGKGRNKVNTKVQSTDAKTGKRKKRTGRK